MKFFVDTADLSEIREAAALGILDGVTTNPSLIAKTGRKHKETIQEICELVDGPVSVEAVSEDFEGMLKEAREFVTWADNVIIKVPLTREGLKACKALSEDGIGVNVTLCFSANQALLAAKAGATYISPFVGRLGRHRAGWNEPDRGHRGDLQPLPGAAHAGARGERALAGSRAQGGAARRRRGDDPGGDHQQDV